MYRWYNLKVGEFQADRMLFVRMDPPPTPIGLGLTLGKESSPKSLQNKQD